MYNIKIDRNFIVLSMLLLMPVYSSPFTATVAALLNRVLHPMGDMHKECDDIKQELKKQKDEINATRKELEDIGATAEDYKSDSVALQKMPKIEHIEWGKIKVAHKGKTYLFDKPHENDVKLWPGCVKRWDWKETDTHHRPGIQKADLKEFIDKIDIVILTRGMRYVLQVPQETIDWVRNECKKECHVGQTEEMVALYNEFAGQGKKVGGLFHSTC